MRYLVLFLALGLLMPQEIEYPPEAQPTPSEEMAFKALGFDVVEDVPIEFTVGDVITVDHLVVLASGVSPTVCQEGVNRINQTAANSGVATARANLVSCYPTTYISSGSGQTDLNRLRTFNDGFMDDALIQRELTFADTVTLVGKSTNVCGYAWLNSSVSNAFSYVADICMSNSSFEHEWGHNVGMAHDLPNAGTLAYPYGAGWCFGNGFKDVLTYPSPCGGNRAAFYSNPDIIYQGRPTGTATANNARVLRERIAVLANFRNSITSFPPTNHGR